MFDLDQTIKDRHSTRKFLSKPVPRILLDEALALAQLAPSNSNTQPWRVVFAEGIRRDQLKTALLKQAQHFDVSQLPRIAQLPEAFQRYRQELGAQVYGAMGIDREDTASRERAVLRNYEFFGAPVVGIVCMHRELGDADALSVGIYITNADTEPDCSWTGHLCSGFASCLSRSHPQRVEYPTGAIDSMWLSRWLYRS